MADQPVTPPSASSDDLTPYIRTYAKDVARLTGTQAAHIAPAKDAPTPGVKFGNIDLSQSQGVRSEESSAKEFQKEVLSITDADTIQDLGEPTPAAKRDEILSRLREKVQPVSSESPTMTPVPLPPVSPVPASDTARMVSAASFGAPVEAFPFHTQPESKPLPEIHESALMPQATAVPAAIPAPMLAPTPADVPTPASLPKNAEPKAKRGFPFFTRHEPKAKPSATPASNLHTFKSDISDHIDAQNASTFSVLAAQSDAKDMPRPNAPKPAVLSSKKKSNLPLILASSVMVVFGIALLGGAYWFVVLRNPAAAAPFSVPSLIFADEKVELPSNAPSLAQAMANVAAQPSVRGNVILTYITATTTNGKKDIIKVPQPGGVLIKQVLSGAPDILLRNISDASTAGIINDGTTNAAFFILQDTSYERTFAGMLGWEPTMATDLAVLYPTPAAPTVGTSTAPQVLIAPHFIDSIVANHDVRILKTGDGRTVLIYGYRDKQTLIIAKDEAAFAAILVRMDSANGS